jgi:hypothetical protein
LRCTRNLRPRFDTTVRTLAAAGLAVTVSLATALKRLDGAGVGPSACSSAVSAPTLHRSARRKGYERAGHILARATRRWRLAERLDEGHNCPQSDWRNIIHCGRDPARDICRSVHIAREGNEVSARRTDRPTKTGVERPAESVVGGPRTIARVLGQPGKEERGQTPVPKDLTTKRWRLAGYFSMGPPGFEPGTDGL